MDLWAEQRIVERPPDARPDDGVSARRAPPRDERHPVVHRSHRRHDRLPVRPPRLLRPSRSPTASDRRRGGPQPRPGVQRRARTAPGATTPLRVRCRRSLSRRRYYFLRPCSAAGRPTCSRTSCPMRTYPADVWRRPTSAPGLRPLDVFTSGPQPLGRRWRPVAPRASSSPTEGVPPVWDGGRGPPTVHQASSNCCARPVPARLITSLHTRRAQDAGWTPNVEWTGQHRAVGTRLR
jgi:hypothetical protein